MCGRYRLSRRKQIVEEHFDSVSGDEDWSPRYNIAPTQPIPVIRLLSKGKEFSMLGKCFPRQQCSQNANLVAQTENMYLFPCWLAA
jgi:putative SOS response-associated peptidase YedK